MLISLTFANYFEQTTYKLVDLPGTFLYLGQFFHPYENRVRGFIFLPGSIHQNCILGAGIIAANHKEFSHHSVPEDGDRIFIRSDGQPSASLFILYRRNSYRQCISGYAKCINTHFRHPFWGADFQIQHSFP